MGNYWCCFETSFKSIYQPHSIYVPHKSIMVLRKTQLKEIDQVLSEFEIPLNRLLQLNRMIVLSEDTMKEAGSIAYDSYSIEAISKFNQCPNYQVYRYCNTGEMIPMTLEELKSHQNLPNNVWTIEKKLQSQFELLKHELQSSKQFHQVSVYNNQFYGSDTCSEEVQQILKQVNQQLLKFKVVVMKLSQQSFVRTLRYLKEEIEQTQYNPYICPSLRVISNSNGSFIIEPFQFQVSELSFKGRRIYEDLKSLSCVFELVSKELPKLRDRMHEYNIKAKQITQKVRVIAKQQGLDEKELQTVIGTVQDNSMKISSGTLLAMTLHENIRKTSLEIQNTFSRSS